MYPKFQVPDKTRSREGLLSVCSDTSGERGQPESVQEAGLQTALPDRSDDLHAGRVARERERERRPRARQLGEHRQTTRYRAEGDNGPALVSRGEREGDDTRLRECENREELRAVVDHRSRTREREDGGRRGRRRERRERTNFQGFQREPGRNR